MTNEAVTSAGGLIAAGSAAALWAAATMLYDRAGRRVGPAALNLVKGVVSCGFFAAALLLLGRPLWEPARAHGFQTLMLAVSGVIGISLGDTAFFAAIQLLGPRRASLLTLLAVPATAAGGLLFLGERLGPLGWLGMAVTLGGVAWVVSERSRIPRPEPGGDFAVGLAPSLSPPPPAGDAKPLLGLAAGVVAALATAAGQLVNRANVRGGAFDPLWAAAWRLAAAVVVLALFLPLISRLFRRPRVRRTPGPFWRFLVPATLMGTFGGIWLQQVAVTRAEVGLALTLLSTSPVWILPMAALTGERITPRAVVGSLVSIAGVALLVLSTR